MSIQGKRHDPTPGDEILEPGEYGKDAAGVWWFRAPVEQGFGMGRLTLHAITEHEDGTITALPSILVTGHHGRQWHGYLERGVWREV